MRFPQKLVLLSAVVLSGCNSTAPFEFGGQRATNAGFAAQNPPPTSQPEAPAPQDGGGHSLYASMRKATGAVSDALTVQPRVTPAADPVSLASQPANVGPDLHYHAARMYEGQQNLPASITHYEQALAVAPNDIRTLLGYARLLDRQENLAGAEQLYRRAIELQPENTSALNDLGMLYARHGQFAHAAQVLEQAVAIQPTDQRYRNNLASVLVDVGNEQAALSHLTAVHGDAIAHYNLGYLLSQRQQNERAADHLRQALNLNPYFEPARTLLGNLQTTSARFQPASASMPEGFEPLSASARAAPVRFPPVESTR